MMSPQSNLTTQPIYQIRITLRRIEPSIWRRVLLRGDTRLGKLHRILQAVMGWENYHLHQFVVGDTSYSSPELGDEMNVESERYVPLHQVLPKLGDTIVYEYDFGDGWKHDLLLEGMFLPDAAVSYPVCVAGERACPPEDCGGVWGYAELLDVLASPTHPRYAELLEWVGGRFDPEAFDLDTANKRLRRVK